MILELSLAGDSQQYGVIWSEKRFADKVSLIKVQSVVEKIDK